MKFHPSVRTKFYALLTAVFVMGLWQFGGMLYSAQTPNPVLDPFETAMPVQPQYTPEIAEARNVQIQDEDVLAGILAAYLTEEDEAFITEDAEPYGPALPYKMARVAYGPAPQRKAENTKTAAYKPDADRPAYEAIKISGRPKIAIIFDDVGMDRKHSLELARMDENLTLAFLPYAPNLDDITGVARSHGHELMIHMPMEALSAPVSLGAIALKSGMDKAEVDAQLDRAFAAFEGYKGLNNHMGSKLTQDAKIMGWVMARLKQKNMYFVDSVTIGSSVAEDVAKDYGIAAGRRDVFLDHVDDLGAVRQAFARLEHVANRQGYAVAIGHPKANTLQGLKEWLPQAKAKGYELVFASALTAAPQKDAPLLIVSHPMPQSGLPQIEADMGSRLQAIAPAAGAETIEWR